MHNTTVETSFNPEIIAYLQGNSFKRVDDGSDKDKMRWVNEHYVMIDLTGNTINVYAVWDEIDALGQLEVKTVLMYSMNMFLQHNARLFALLMDNWSVIPLQADAVMITKSKLSESLTKINFN